MASRGVLIVAQHPREPFRLPTFLPTPSTTPFPHTPVCSHSPPCLPPRPLHSLVRPRPLELPFSSDLPLLQQTRGFPLLLLVLLDPLDETPSDIHRHVSSKLIMKCIIVSRASIFRLLFSPSLDHAKFHSVPALCRLSSLPPR